jgi:hypothetical protein
MATQQLEQQQAQLQQLLQQNLQQQRKQQLLRQLLTPQQLQQIQQLHQSQQQQLQQLHQQQQQAAQSSQQQQRQDHIQQLRNLQHQLQQQHAFLIQQQHQQQQQQLHQQQQQHLQQEKQLLHPLLPPHLVKQLPPQQQQELQQLFVTIHQLEQRRQFEQQRQLEQQQSGQQDSIQVQTDGFPSKSMKSVPIYKASIVEPSRPSQEKPKTDHAVSGDTIQRIKKCLSRANHPATLESEAKAALHVASRLMAQHNVTQAEVLADESESSRLQFAGQSVVALRRSDGDRHKRIRIEGYMDYLTEAIQTFFNCKSYSTRKYGAMDYTFYGLTDNTVAAASAFEMVFNLASSWALKYRGRDRTSYLLGICQTLRQTAKKEAADEVERAKKAEQDASVSETSLETEKRENPTKSQLVDDTNGPPSSPQDARSIPFTDPGNDALVSAPSEDGDLGTAEDPVVIPLDKDDVKDDESDEEMNDCVEPDFSTASSDSIDPLMDIDKEIHRLASKTENQARGRDDDHTRAPQPNDGSQWKSHMQLAIFRKTADDIADDYLKSRGVKLGSGRARSYRVHNMAAFSQGSQDSKKIDVRRKMLSS